MQEVFSAKKSLKFHNSIHKKKRDTTGFLTFYVQAIRPLTLKKQNLFIEKIDAIRNLFQYFIKDLSGIFLGSYLWQSLKASFPMLVIEVDDKLSLFIVNAIK